MSAPPIQYMPKYVGIAAMPETQEFLALREDGELYSVYYDRGKEGWRWHPILSLPQKEEK